MAVKATQVHIRTSRLLLWMAALLAGAVWPGCGGYTIHRPFLLGMDPCVEWVFQAPTQFGKGMFIGFTLGMGEERIGGATLTEDGKLILLTNYGTGYWFSQSANIYLLDLASGRVIRHVGGLPDSGREWCVDGKTVYLQGRMAHSMEFFLPQKGRSRWIQMWWSADLITGRVRKELLEPKGEKQKAFGQQMERYEAPVPSTHEPPDESCGYKSKSEHQLGGGRQLVFTQWEQWWICRALGARVPIMDLAWTDAASRRHTRRLGRLRLANPDACYLLASDKRRLVFCTGRYVICVDMRGLPSPNSTTQPTPTTDRKGR